MSFVNRRAVYYLGLVSVATVGLTLVYSAGMTIWEGQSQPLYRSLQVVVQSFTTTGYGEDAPWQTPQMNILVILIQFSGIGLILTAVDVFAVPWLRSALAPVAPTTLPERNDHVVICGHTPRTDKFIEELDARDRPYVLLESEEELAQKLHEDDYDVIHGDPESATALERAHVGAAHAVVADVADDTNASIVLAAHDVNPDVRVVTLIEDAELAQYHTVAGAAEVLSPRQLLGESLAAERPTAVTITVDESVVAGDAFELVELTIEAGSELSQTAFEDAQLTELYGVNVVGAWIENSFETSIAPETELGPHTRLLVAGDPDQVTELREATASTLRPLSPERVILAGYGESGQSAYDALAETNSEVTVLDVKEKSGVDIIGDARDPAVLQEARVDDASALLLMIGDDTAATMSTLIARDLNPDLRIIVRANEEDNIQKLYRAGADYVLSLATTSGRMLASTIFEDEDVLTYSTQIRVVRHPAAGLVGTTLADADVRSETGSTVLAVRRDDEIITDFDPWAFEFQKGDDVILAGTDENVTEFKQQYGG